MERVDVGDVADEAEPLVAHLHRDEPGVLARQADRERAVLVRPRADDLPVDLADQRHAHDVDGLGVGDPQAVDELRHLAQPLHQVADLRAAAVHDDRVHADEPHEHDVLREEIGERGVFHRVAAVLDHDGLARELPDVRQRLGEHAGLGEDVGRRRSRGAHVLVDVRVGEVGEQHRRGAGARVQVAFDLDVALLHERRERGRVVRRRRYPFRHTSTPW